MWTFYTLLVLMIACSPTKHVVSNGGDLYSAKLTKKIASERKKNISDIHYHMDFQFKRNANHFNADILIEFKLKHIKTPLRLDFSEGTIHSVIVNNKEDKNFFYNKNALVLDPQYLKTGHNSLRINYQKEFSNNSVGLYRFKDPIDERVYIYSDLQPYDANKVYPCFDQPNLKAKFTVNVTAPKEWKVITSVQENTIKQQKHHRQWTFPTSQKISTYTWSLHLGDYAKITDKNSKYPTKIYMRHSLKPYLNKDFWFKYTRLGLDFFENFFNSKYPYQKYDIVIAPDLEAAAMENVAAVTFNEKFITRGKKNRHQELRLANVILHEMAHMWFGNLVSIDWWDDLWLNEGFATYISFWAMSQIPDLKEDAWRLFNKKKRRAYWQELHTKDKNIISNIKDTDHAHSHFDALTYGKGAAFLKQIHFHLGEKTFKKAIQIYIKNNIHKNASADEFFATLEKLSNKDLKTWRDKWLSSPGLNNITVNHKCHDDNIVKIHILQEGKTLRPHSFNIALLSKNDKEIVISDKIHVKMPSHKKYMITLNDSKCPELIYPNIDDNGHFKIIHSKKSLDFITKNIDKIQSVFFRQKLWNDLWDHVYYSKLDYQSFLKLVLSKGLPQEKDDIILKNITRNIHGKFSLSNSLLLYIKNDSSLTVKERNALLKGIEHALLTQVTNKQNKDSIKNIMLDAFIASVTTNKSQQYLVNLLNENKIIDQDRRWDALLKLSALGNEQAHTLAKQEKNSDTSSRAKKMLFAISAAKPHWKSKAFWVNEYKSNESRFSYSEIKKALLSSYHKSQTELRDQYIEDYFNDLIEINEIKNSHELKMYGKLAPFRCSSEYAEFIQEFLKEHQDLNKNVHKRLYIVSKESQYCDKITRKNSQDELKQRRPANDSSQSSYEYSHLAQ